MREGKINIAIDGSAASGKTTIGKKLARKINYQFLDSGLLFRHFAKFYQEKNFLEREEKIILWQKQFANNQREFVQRLEKERATLNSPLIGDLASQLAPIPELRQITLLFQRQLTQEKGWVVVGRDITSEVLPQAEVKIFLTASLETRITRRYQEQKGKNDLATVKQELLTRDERDKNRPLAPLKKTVDSWEIDTTNLSPEESVEKIHGIILKKYLEEEV